MKPPAFTIHGAPIPWSYWVMIRRDYCHDDERQAARVFYRAMMAKPKDVIAWVSQGLKPNGYCWNAHQSETDAPDRARVWCEDLIATLHYAKPAAGPAPLKDALRDTLEQMIDNLK